MERDARAATSRPPAILPFAKTLGIELTSARAEEVRCRVQRTDHLAGIGLALHGGAITGVADAAAGICAHLNHPKDAAGTTTIESSTRFLRAFRSGGVEAIARPLRAGRSILVVDTDVLDDDQRVIARVTQSQLVLPAPTTSKPPSRRTA